MKRQNNLILKNLFVLFICSITYLQTTAQTKEVFYEDFSSNKNEWEELSNDDATSKIENGKYVVVGKTHGFGQQTRVPIDNVKDFSIGITVSMKSNVDYKTGLINLIFCSNVRDEYTFALLSSGKWGLSESSNGKQTMIKFDTSRFINQGFGVLNKLRIDKRGKIWELFINDSSVYTMPAGTYFGHTIGFFCDKQTKAEFDDLKVTGTPFFVSANLCKVLPIIYESAKLNFSFILGKPVSKNNTENFKSLVEPIGDANAFTLISYTDDNNYFETIMYEFSNKGLAIQKLKAIVAELQKCLPAFQFSAGTDVRDELQYTISEKSNNAPKLPAATIGIKSFESAKKFNIHFIVVSDAILK